MRECGECSVCCYVGEVSELTPAYSDCPYLVSGEHRCGIYDEPDKPNVCTTFECAWLRGIGDEYHRPDKIGAMFSLNKTPRGAIGYCIETEPDAITTTARDMALAFVAAWHFPIVVSEYGKQPPHDKGDWVVIRADQELKAVMMLGAHREELGYEVNLFDLMGTK
jgi:hypothetical protein